VLRNKLDPDRVQRTKSILPNAQFADTSGDAEDLLDAAPQVLAKLIGGFLRGP
jgi:hypothetical protein